MKRLKMFLLISIFAFQAMGQSLLQLYQTGRLKLIPDENYAKGTDWNAVFPDYKLVSGGNAIGRYKSIAVAPDGSIFVGNYSSYTIQKFNSDGKLLKSFGKKGNADADFKQRPTLGGVVGGKYVFTHEHNGHIKLFTLNGEFVKNIVLDYMPLKAIALDSNKIAVVGHVPMGEKVRYVVTLIDSESGTTNIIRRFDDIFDRNVSLSVNKDGYLYSCSPMASSVSIIIRAIPNGNILVGETDSKRVEIYNSNGKLTNSFDLDFTNLTYPEDLKKEFTAQMEEMVDDGKFSKSEISPIYDKDFFPKHMPFFYNILVDPNGNLLVFMFTDEDVDHKFRVFAFDSKGKNLAEATLEIPNFSLSLNYRFEELAFHDGNIIGLLQSNDKESAARLVKLKYQ
jgi:hypothetical protein